MAGDNVGMLDATGATADLHSVRTEPFSFGRADGARIELISADPRLGVVLANATFHKGMDQDDFFHELVRCLPPGYEATSPQGSVAEVLIVDIFPTPSRGGSPEVGFTCTDPSQRVRWAGKNKFTIEGRAARSLSIRSELEIELEGRRIKVILGGGEHPIATANRIRQALPPGYTAMIELPLFSGAEVVVTVLRRHS